MLGTDQVSTKPTGTSDRFGPSVYPNAFFDPASWYLPPTVKELYRWCAFLFLTNPIIGPVVRKKASYVVTDLVYETDNVMVEKIYKHLLEKVLKIREFEIQMLMDFEVFGNAFCSIVFPFERYLVCPACSFENLLKNTKWTYEGHRFYAKCTNCHTNTEMEIKDKPIRNRAAVRLVRWFPQYIDVRYNNFTGASEYVLRIPRWMKTRIENPKINQVFVKDTPKEFLEAIRDNNNIVFDAHNIYHMKNETISMEDASMGLPPILNVFKEVWLWQTYKRGQSAIALEHALPMTLLSPAPAPGAPSPHMSGDLGSWQGKLGTMVDKWRRDQNAMFTVPFPVQVSQVRGDAQALSLHNDMAQVREQIAGGMDVPSSFLYGGLTWTGASVDLRVLENLLINRVGRCDDFLGDWLVPALRRYFRLPRLVVRHADFKMADDVQQKQIAMNLRATNTVSDRTVMEELSFDYAKEEKFKREESDARLKDMEKQQIAQANLQSKISWIQARTEAAIQAWRVAQMPQQPGMMPAPGQEVPPEAAPVDLPVTTSTNSSLSPSTVDLMATHFLKTTSPDEVPNRLMFMKQSEPVLAAAIENRLKIIQQNSVDMQPMPEQKPPRRGPATAVI